SRKRSPFALLQASKQRRSTEKETCRETINSTASAARYEIRNAAVDEIESRQPRIVVPPDSSATAVTFPHSELNLPVVHSLSTGKTTLPDARHERNYVMKVTGRDIG